METAIENSIDVLAQECHTAEELEFVVAAGLESLKQAHKYAQACVNYAVAAERESQFYDQLTMREMLTILRRLIESPNAKQNDLWDRAREVVANASI